MQFLLVVVLVCVCCSLYVNGCCRAMCVSFVFVLVVAMRSPGGHIGSGVGADQRMAHRF